MLYYLAAVFVMPLLLAMTAAYLIRHSMMPEELKYKRDVEKAAQIIMTEYELAIVRANPIERTIYRLLPKAAKYVNLDRLFITDMRQMLEIMGDRRSAEGMIAAAFAKSLIGGTPFLILPLLLGDVRYLLLVPIVSIVLTYYIAYQGLKSEYKKWQIAIQKELPDLIDKLRIAFSSGRDYISAFRQAQKNSGGRMKILLEKLFNDLQTMQAAKALDQFAWSIRMPVVNKFCGAVKIAIESGYESADTYFAAIETDIEELRRIAVEEVTKSKPEKVLYLYLIMITLALASFAIKAVEIFAQLGRVA